jgi:hypothetical protein
MPNKLNLAVSDSTCRSAPKALGQCKGDIRSWYRCLQRRMVVKIVGISSRLCSGTEYDIFTSMDLVYRGHSLNGSFHLRFPQDSACRRIEGSNLAVACARENQTTGGQHGAHFRKMRAGILGSGRKQ